MPYKSIYGGSSDSDSSGYKSIYGGSKPKSPSGPSVKSLDDIKSFAATKGLEVKEKQPSFFTKAIDFMSRPVFASAGAAKALVKNFDSNVTNNENPLWEAWKGLKGEEKETYSDVLKEAGVKNKIATGLVGFALDVALDPTTYIGGSLVKGALKTGAKTAKVGLNLTRRFNPDLARGIEVAGTTLKDALGNAFVHGYGTSEGLASGISKYYNKLGIKTDETISKFDEVFKNLPKEQHTEFAQTLSEHRKQLIGINKKIKEESLGEFNKYFGGTSPLKDVKQAEVRFGGAKNFEQKFESSASKVTGRLQKTLDNFTKKTERFKKQREIKLADKKDLLEVKIGENITSKTASLNTRLEKVLKDELNLFTGDLLDIEKSLKSNIVKDGLLKGSMKDLADPTAKEFDDIVQSALGPIRDDIEESIAKLQQEVLDSSGKEFLSKGMGFTNSKEAIAKMLQDKIVTTQNDYNKLVFEMEDKISKQINELRNKVAEKLNAKQSEITSKIINLQNETSVKQSIASKFFNSRKLAKNKLNELMPTFKTPEQAKFFNEHYVRTADEMADSINLPPSQRFKAYFPSIDVERLKSPATGRAASITDESYKKLYKGLVEKELDKPVEALTRTQLKIFRDNLSRETLNDAVTNFGKATTEFKSEAEAAKAGYRLIKEKQFGKGVGYLKEGDFNYINNYLYPELKSIDMLAKASGYDAFSKMFKGAVTSWFPAFHVRNAISGVIQNYEVFGARAFDPSNIASGLAVLKGADRDLKLGGKIYKASELNKVLKENFGGSSRYVSDLGDYIQELTDGSYKVLNKMDPKRLGNFIESNQKANALVIGLKQGKSIDEAVKLAEQAGFNYQNITKFESKVMRRLIPFYSFMRKNAELQGRTLIKNPERILNQAKAATAIGNMFGQKVTEEDLQGVPPWALQGLGFKIKDNKYVSQFGLPIEEFLNRVNNPIMSTLSSLNPLIKYPLEAKLGYDFFRDAKLIDVNTVAKGTGEVLWQAQESGKLPKELAEAINIKKFKDPNTDEIKYSMSPTALHLLRNLPTSRLENTLNKVFDKDTDQVQKLVAFFSGGKIYDIDTEKQKYFNERDLRRDLEDWLLSIGEGKKFEQFYLPKREEVKE